MFVYRRVPRSINHCGCGWRPKCVGLASLVNLPFLQECQKIIHSGNLTSQWKMDPLKMYFLLKMGIFQPAMLDMLVYQRVIPFRKLSYSFGLRSTPQSGCNRHKWRFIVGIPDRKNGIILMVTGIPGPSAGVVPTYSKAPIYPFP